MNGLFGLRVPKDTVGLILSGVEARLLHDDGCDVDVDEPGELWVRAPCVVPGYYGNEQATKETFVDGWLRTGDTLKADKDGFLLCVSRYNNRVVVPEFGVVASSSGRKIPSKSAGSRSLPPRSKTFSAPIPIS